MSDLKFGHRVQVFNDEEQKWEKGQYIKFSDAYTPHLHHVLLQESECFEAFTKCRLDPEATEFLPGDEVEVRDRDGGGWKLGLYAGFIPNSDSPHHIEFGKGESLPYKQCRYRQPTEQPAEQPEPVRIIELNGKKYEIREVQE